MPNNDHIYTQVIEAIDSQTPCMLASVIHIENSTSATVGDKALITIDGDISGWIGGGCCQSVVKNIAPQLLKENTPRVIRICPEQAFVEGMFCYPSHCPSEGTVDIFLEPIAKQQTVRLYGNTPITQSIARYSDELNIHLDWRQSLDEHTKKESTNSVAIAIIATQGRGDLTALKQVVADKVEHILLVASRKKAIALKEKLKQTGACTHAIDRIIAPAGIEIGAASGPEIALSIMAKIVSLRSQVSSPASQQTAKKATENKTLKNNAPLVEALPPHNTSSSCCGET